MCFSLLDRHTYLLGKNHLYYQGFLWIPIWLCQSTYVLINWWWHTCNFFQLDLQEAHSIQTLIVKAECAYLESCSQSPKKTGHYHFYHWSPKKTGLWHLLYPSFEIYDYQKLKSLCFSLLLFCCTYFSIQHKCEEIDKYVFYNSEYWSHNLITVINIVL